MFSHELSILKYYVGSNYRIRKEGRNIREGENRDQNDQQGPFHIRNALNKIDVSRKKEAKRIAEQKREETTLVSDSFLALNLIETNILRTCINIYV